MSKSKAIQKRIDELRSEIQKHLPPGPAWRAEQRVMAHVGELMAAISEQAELSTRRIVRLTWALVILTAGLLLFTVFLYQDTHKNGQGDNFTEHRPQ